MIPRTKVFVGSLPPGSKPEELRRLFENYGVVTECDIMNRCGFVHMETQEMAENAIRALNNTNFKGSTISVEAGRMKDHGGPRQGSNMGGMGMIVGRGGGRGRMIGGDRRGGGMRRGGMGGPRGGSGSDGGGRGFGNHNNQGVGGGMRGARGGVGGGLGGPGPIRRDRGGFHQRGGPYNRSVVVGGPSGGFDKWQSGGGGPKGGNRSYDDNGSGGYSSGLHGGLGGGGNMVAGDRFNSGGFGMGNQDRRGFALPESRQMFGNEMGNQSRGPLMGGSRGGGGFRGANQSFDRRQGFNNGGDNFSRRGPGIGGNMNAEGIGGGRAGGFHRGGGNMGGGSLGGGNYNQSFPPLGAGGGNRNGPRRDMPNRRY